MEADNAVLDVGVGVELKKMQIDGENYCSQGVTKKGNKNKPYCFKCFTKGHIMTDCSAAICCDVCDSDSHVTKACP